MPTARINDLDMYYEVEGEGPWVVFAHGGGSTHVAWWQQVYALRDRYRCVTFDARDSGQTRGPSTPLNAVEANGVAGRDLLGLMDHLKIDKAVLNGWSAGGLSVSTVAQTNPERVLGLVMTDTPFGLQTDALRKWAGEMVDKIGKGFDIRDHLAAPGFPERDPDGFALMQALRTLNAGTRPKDTGQYQQRFGDAYAQMRDTPAKDYSKFPVPSLFIVGDQDGLTLPWLIRDTAAAVRGSRFVTIKDVGHATPMEKPDVYNAILLSFLDNVTAAKA